MEHTPPQGVCSEQSRGEKRRAHTHTHTDRHRQKTQTQTDTDRHRQTYVCIYHITVSHKVQRERRERMIELFVAPTARSRQTNTLQPIHAQPLLHSHSHSHTDTHSHTHSHTYTYHLQNLPSRNEKGRIGSLVRMVARKMIYCLGVQFRVGELVVEQLAVSIQVP